MSQISKDITNNFQLLAGNLTLLEAMAELVTDNYGVILDKGLKPVALVIVDDLRQAVNQGANSLLDVKSGFPPTIVIDSPVYIQDLLKWEELMEPYEKSRGVIIIDDNKIVGVLAVTTVRKYLNNRDYHLRGNTIPSDIKLSGEYQLSWCSIRCEKCGFLNTLDYFDRKKLPSCQNPDQSNSNHEIGLKSP